MGKKTGRKALVVVYWDHPDTNERQILLLKRGEKDGGDWQPVTGNAEAGEDFAETALREAQEETGLRFSGRPKDLGIHHEFVGRWGPMAEQCFSLRAAGEGSTPPKPTIDPKEHVDWEWCDMFTAHDRVPHKHAKEAIFRASYRPSPLTLTADGDWFQEGEKVTHQRTVELLHRHLIQRENAAGELEFVVRVDDSELPVIVEDAPIHIIAVDREKGKLRTLAGEDEELDPTTIEQSDANILYCRVRGMRAKFHRQAYYELAKDIREERNGSKEYVLHWLGNDHPLRIAHQ